MKLLRVAAATLNQTPLDWAGNARRIREALEDARKEGVGLLCCPELCITGYGCEDAFLSPSVAATAMEVLCELLPETQGLCVCLGLPVVLHKAVYNACALACDGKLLGLVAKQALAGDGIHYEPRWFKPWPEGQRSSLTVQGSRYPMGDLVFDVDGVRIGFEICEDAWTSERPGALLTKRAVDVILNPSASHFAFGKHEVRKRLVLEGARAFGVTYVYSNLLGNEAGRVVYDGDAIIATDRGILASAPRFSFREHTLVSAVVDVELTRTHHLGRSSYRPFVHDDAEGVVYVAHEWPAVSLGATRAYDEHGATSVVRESLDPHLKYEEFTRAQMLGLFDYLRKSRSRGFVVSLSGGADSSTISCLIYLMVQEGLRTLGAKGLFERLGYVGGVSETSTAREWMSQLLTTVYQATNNSSETTRSAAETLATAIGSTHLELNVDSLVEDYKRIVSTALGRTLDWARDDLALQNIQARVRAPSAWLIANLKGALLLATSNRSEAAVGYATMDGDTAGGLSPIAGIDKAFIRRYLVWLEQEGLSELGPVLALSVVNVQAPTAELRPSSQGQTDEADLMPYDLLDVIERKSIADRYGPVDVFSAIASEFPQYSEEQLLQWLERFYALFCRNQWKRERYAPSFHVDDANLDPKTWCRFPILSGGYVRELAELRAKLGRT